MDRARLGQDPMKNSGGDTNGIIRDLMGSPADRTPEGCGSSEDARRPSGRRVKDIKRMPDIAIRVTGAEAMQKVLVMLQENKHYVGYAVKEVGTEEEHEHMHALIIDQDINSVRQKIKWVLQKFKLGNGVYSVSLVKDIDCYKQYMAKGESRESLPEVIWSRIDDLNVEELHMKYWEVNDSLKRKEKVKNVVELVKQRCIEKNVDLKDPFVEEAVIDSYLDVCQQGECKFDRFNGMRVVDTVMLKLCKGTSQERDVRQALRDALRR